jgi:hypothetical protein
VFLLLSTQFIEEIIGSCVLPARLQGTALILRHVHQRENRTRRLKLMPDYLLQIRVIRLLSLADHEARQVDKER